MKKLSMDRLRCLTILVPQVEAQSGVARVLTAVDAVYARLESVCGAKRRLKQALLQQLLTGKLRFPQFEGARAARAPLASIAAPVAARVEPNSVAPSTPCVELEHIAQGVGRLIGSTTASSVTSLKTSFRRGDVLFGKLRPYLRKFAGPSFDGLCSTEIWALRPREGVCRSDYLLQLVQSESVLRAACASTGTKMPRAEWDVVGAALVWLPEPTEQERIASLMGLLDTELTFLDRQLAAVRKLKRGLMQKLLTGELEVPAADESKGDEVHA